VLYAAPEVKHIYLWIGAESSVDEQGTLAAKAVELDGALRGAPHQHRVEQGREDALFLALFRDQGGFRVRAGGATSGFSHVAHFWEVPLERLPQLVRLRAPTDGNGAQSAAESVPLTARSLCASDVAVLDTGSTTFLWLGKTSPQALCNAGSALAAKFKLSRRSDSVVLPRCDASPALRAAFWAVLGGSEADVAPARGDGKPPRREVSLLRLSGGGGDGASAALTPVPRAAWGGGAPPAALLPGPASGETAIVDAGSDVYFYVPAGGAQPAVVEAQRRAALAYAEQRAPGAGFHVIKANIVPASFSDLFAHAAPPHTHDLSSRRAPAEEHAAAPRGGAAAALTAVRSLLAEWAPVAHPRKETLAVRVFRMRGNDVEEHPRQLYGKLFSGDCYVVSHAFRLVGGGGGDSTHEEVYFWLGRHSSPLEQGTFTAAARYNGGPALQTVTLSPPLPKQATRRTWL
jgi:hypothetical protein